MGRPLLVLGVGNVLMSDDGVGVHVVRALDAGRAIDDDGGLPPGASVVDGGTAGLSLLPLIGQAGAMVVVDAVDVGAAPGTVHVLTGADLHSGRFHLSVHQVGTADLLSAAALLGTLPADVLLIGIQPARIEPGLQMSPKVRSAVPLAVQTVRTCAQRLAG
jgi:hydrogenase maturation protease